MRTISFLFVMFFSLYISAFSQNYEVFLYQKKGTPVYSERSNGEKEFTFFLKNMSEQKAQSFSNLFKGERGVNNVDFSKSDNGYKVTLTLYKYANTSRYYWFLLKRNHVSKITTPEKSYLIDDYFDIHDKIKMKNLSN